MTAPTHKVPARMVHLTSLPSDPPMFLRSSCQREMTLNDDPKPYR
jgi:hypothetical protein